MSKTYMTRGINDEIARNDKFAKEICDIVKRFAAKDWGILCDDDKQMNEDALRNGNGRVFAAYNTSVKKVYLITDGLKTEYEATTILFAEEY